MSTKAKKEEKKDKKKEIAFASTALLCRIFTVLPRDESRGKIKLNKRNKNGKVI